jgi:hypothetical protein
MILPRLVSILAMACAATLTARAAPPNLGALDVSGAAVVAQLQHLATYTDDPNPAVTRILFTGKQNLARSIAMRHPAAAHLFLSIFQRMTCGRGPT